jgi:hypothetical protein
VIKVCDDLIAELLAEVDSKDDNDFDSGPDYSGDDDGGATENTKVDPEEVPKEYGPQE